MTPIATSLITLACIMGGMLFGMFLRTLLPKHHLTDDSKDVIKMGTGMVATMAALVLGLVVASAKGTFDTLNSGVRQAGTKIIQLDRTMASYGPETREARDVLRRGVTTAMERIWPADKKAIAVEKVGHSGVAIGELEEKLRKLSPRNDDQRGLQSRALQVSSEIADAISQIIQQSGQTSVPVPFLVLLVCWLTIIFFSFGLFTSPNTTVIVILLVCAMSAASALFLILELDQPYAGIIKISSAPLQNALARIGQ
jgi:hypothetical protein